MRASVEPTLTDTGFAFGSTLIRFRQEHGWRQADLAQAVGCTRAFISRLEHDDKPPSARLLDEIIRALGLAQEQADELREAVQLDRGVVAFPASMPRSVRRELLRLIKGQQIPSLGSWKSCSVESAT